MVDESSGSFIVHLFVIIFLESIGTCKLGNSVGSHVMISRMEIWANSFSGEEQEMQLLAQFHLIRIPN